MTKLSRSASSGTFQKDTYVKRQEAEGLEPNEDYIELFKSFEQQKFEQEQDPEWQENNMEYDLRSTDWILAKVRASEKYAQNLYSAMCNNEFQRRDVMPILKNETWHCSWRYAGGIVADMREEGDYIDWYCSGINDGAAAFSNGYVAEGVVTPEIEEDLVELGWNVVDSGETDY